MCVGGGDNDDEDWESVGGWGTMRTKTGKIGGGEGGNEDEDWESGGGGGATRKKTGEGGWVVEGKQGRSGRH